MRPSAPSSRSCAAVGGSPAARGRRRPRRDRVRPSVAPPRGRGRRDRRRTHLLFCFVLEGTRESAACGRWRPHAALRRLPARSKQGPGASAGVPIWSRHAGGAQECRSGAHLAPARRRQTRARWRREGRWSGRAGNWRGSLLRGDGMVADFAAERKEEGRHGAGQQEQDSEWKSVLLLCTGTVRQSCTCNAVPIFGTQKSMRQPKGQEIIKGAEGKFCTISLQLELLRQV